MALLVKLHSPNFGSTAFISLNYFLCYKLWALFLKWKDLQNTHTKKGRVLSSVWSLTTVVNPH